MAQGVKLKKKVLILGSTGLIGHQVFNYLDYTNKYNLFNSAFRKKLNENTVLIDARNESELFNSIEKINPSVIVNCIGILISGAKENPENAIFLNSYLPNKIAKFASKINSKLIHISTDCVFSGKKLSPYFENDFRDANDVYGRSKALGEIIQPPHLTLRTSVVGPELKSNGEELFHWFMTQENSKIEGFTKSIWSGVSTIELAKAVSSSIDKNLTGLHHVTNNEVINKFDLLSLFQKHTKKDVKIIKVSGRETDKSFVDTRNNLDISIPSYDQMIEEMVELIHTKNDLYEQYN